MKNFRRIQWFLSLVILAMCSVAQAQHTQQEAEDAMAALDHEVQEASMLYATADTELNLCKDTYETASERLAAITGSPPQELIGEIEWNIEMAELEYLAGRMDWDEAWLGLDYGMNQQLEAQVEYTAEDYTKCVQACNLGMIGCNDSDSWSTAAYDHAIEGTYLGMQAHSLLDEAEMYP